MILAGHQFSMPGKQCKSREQGSEVRLQPASGLEVIHLQSESLFNHVEVLITEMP